MSRDKNTASDILLNPLVLWCLHHRPTGLQLDGLKVTEVRIFMSQWQTEDLANWFCWQEGWKHWRPLASETQLLKPMQRKRLSPPPILYDGDAADDFVIVNEGKEMGASHFEENVAEYSLRDLPALIERDYVVREHRRLQKRFAVKIVVNGQVFRSHTVDVSAGGVLLEDPLPVWVAGYCRMALRKMEKKEEVRLNCSVVEDPERRRLALNNLSEQDEKSLMFWLAA